MILGHTAERAGLARPPVGGHVAGDDDSVRSSMTKPFAGEIRIGVIGTGQIATGTSTSQY